MRTKAARKTPTGPAASAAAQELSRRQARRRRRSALWALMFPLLFATVIAIGLLAMFFKRMDFFRPAHADAAVLRNIDPS